MKFLIQGMVTVSCWTEVEAETEEEAVAIAKQRSMADIHIDGSYQEDEYWHMEIDGEPTDVRFDDA